MMRAILLCAAIATVSGATIETIETPNNNTSNVTKREILEFYPDWVPFKNKRGDELGEFVDVTKPKAKVKKRLALPMNFLLRSVSEDSDDYNGQGESDSDDYYDKKDWSDLNRPESNTSSPAQTQNLKQEKLSDIDGVLNIITQQTPSLADDINKSIPLPVGYNKDERKYNQDEQKNYPDEQKESLKVLSKEEEYSSSTPEPSLPEVKGKREQNEDEVSETPKPKVQSFEEYEDEEEPTTKKPELTEEERIANEERKRIILDSVDQLKSRHEAEQRSIFEKTKEEELDNEFRHKSLKKHRGRGSKRKPSKPTPPNYDEYEDLSWKDKYNIIVEKKTTTEDYPITSTSEPTTNHRQETDSTHSSAEKLVSVESPKYSVFRNPNLFILDDEDLNEKTNHVPTKAPKRFSAKYSSVPANTIDSAENNITPAPRTTSVETVEPILYFPKVKSKRRKQKKARKFFTTTTAPDSSVAETVEDKLLKQTTVSVTYPDTTAPATAIDYKTTAIDNDYPTSTDSLWKEAKPKDNKQTTSTAQDTDTTVYTTAPAEDLKTTADLTSPSGYSAEAEPSNTDTVTDAVPAPSHHEKIEPKDYHIEKGGGHEHHSSHEEEHEEHGKKAYEGLHKNHKGKKGHHDREDHLGKYEDHGGHDKSHHDESSHYGGHHHEEHGKKHAKYEESGKHSKGHSTKGSHDIHKKEEYEKNVEFFEEEGDSAEEEKHGGYHNEKEHKSVSGREKGGQFKRGNLNNEHHEKKKGESGHFLKGGHHDVNKGHKLSAGHDSHGKNGLAKHHAGSGQGGKKWVYHHGSPAKNANLIVIDRRTDRYMHGPNYYG